MSLLRVILAAVAISGIPASLMADEPSAAALLDLHTAEAKAYGMFRDEARKDPLEFQAKSVFNWTNLAGEKTQTGHLFVWTRAGRPEVIGTIFSNKTRVPGQRLIVHEFHTLATEKLFPVTPANSENQWTPEKGIALLPVDDAPAVADGGTQRLQQMRTIARGFSAETESPNQGQKWELRLLPRPLLQYQPTSGDILDGALFAMVSSAGTDPEVLLVIEARHPSKDSPAWTWHAAAVRFSDKDLAIQRNNQTVWSSHEDETHKVAITKEYTLLYTPDRTYMCYAARTIDELPAEK